MDLFRAQSKLSVALATQLVLSNSLFYRRIYGPKMQRWSEFHRNRGCKK